MWTTRPMLWSVPPMCLPHLLCQPDLCSGFPVYCPMGLLCGLAVHIMKLLSADWVFCALITLALKQTLVLTPNDIG